MGIQEIINSITREYSIQSQPLMAFPTLSPYPQIIEELVKSIANAISSLKGYVESGACDPIIDSLWSCHINESEELTRRILELKLSDKLKKENVFTIEKLKTVDSNFYPDNDRLQVDEAKNVIKKLELVVEKEFNTIKTIWSLIQSLSIIRINFIETNNPTITQIFSWSFLLSFYAHVPQDKAFPSPQWGDLCDKIKTCICKDDDEKPQTWFVVISFIILVVLCVIYGITCCKGVYWESLLLAFVFMSSLVTFSILALYKFTQFLNLQCEQKKKLKEKIIDKVINAFNEDRENAMLHTKTELSLNEKKEKACLEEWERDKEHVRKMNILEHDRKAKLNDVLIELAKIQNKTTKIDSQKKEQPSKDTPKEKTINEESILPILLNLK